MEKENINNVLPRIMTDIEQYMDHSTKREKWIQTKWMLNLNETLIHQYLNVSQNKGLK